MAVPYTFGTATSSIPLSQLDSNFATVITLGNTAIQLGNTVTTLNNMTLANVTISSGNITLTNVSATTANVTTANITTAVIGTETVTTSTITSANITTANVTTANITTGNVTTGTVSTSLTLSYGTANAVAYLNGSKVVTTGSALTFDGTNFATTGTATAAKLIPTGSSATGNGLYLPAANALGLSTNGTNAVYIDASQNVGIGTSSPAQKLDATVSSGTEGDGLAVTNMQTAGGSGGYGSGINFYSVRGDGTTKLAAGAIRMFGSASWADAGSTSSNMRFYTVGANTFSERMRIDSSGNVLVTSAAGLGYGTGSGGTVTQATSKSTAVTLNKPTGQITMNAAALAAGATVGFSFNNSVMSVNDVLVLSINANSPNGASYSVKGIASSSASVFLTNTSAGSLSDAVIINFAIIKGATS